MSEDADQLDLFVSLYSGSDEVVHVPDSETSTAVEQCFRFLALCASGKAASKLDPSSDVYSLALTINEIYNSLEQIRIYVITDRVARAKNFKPREIAGKTIKLEVMDIERLWRHTSEGKPREELIVDFSEVSGTPLPCVYVPGDAGEYDYILTAIPGEALRFMYEKYGQRLLEANVRSFLSVRAKGVNAGIQTTLRSTPERFMAYNNGLVMVVDEVKTRTFVQWRSWYFVVEGNADCEWWSDHSIDLLHQEAIPRIRISPGCRFRQRSFFSRSPIPREKKP